MPQYEGQGQARSWGLWGHRGEARQDQEMERGGLIPLHLSSVLVAGLYLTNGRQVKCCLVALIKRMQM